MNVIYSYTQKMAIEDGVLIPVDPEICQEAGIKIPVIIGNRLWYEWINVPEGLEGIQDLEGRLWDTLYMFTFAVKRKRITGTTGKYTVIYTDENQKQVEIEILAVCGPGDNGEPTITLMLPEEY